MANLQKFVEAVHLGDRVKAEFYLPAQGWKVYVTAAVVDGAPALLSLRLEGDESHLIGTDGLRALRPRDLANAAAAVMYGDFLSAASGKPRGKREGRRWSDEHWPQVAATYLEAQIKAKDPYEAISRRWGLTYRTARWHVQRARDKGAFDPPQGKQR